jgi:hypothetical protein
MKLAMRKLQLVTARTKPGPHKIRITQEDLAEEELLRQESKAASEHWRTKRLEIRTALEAGAVVEPGIRLATLKKRKVLIVR